MDRQPHLEGERVLLRPLVSDDWEALFQVASNPEVWAQHPMHDRWEEAVFREFFDDALTKGGALAVIDTAAGELIGSSRFQEFEPAQGGSVEIGWTFIAPSHWGTGVNAEMKQLMLTHAFQYVDRVDFRVGEENIRSRKAVEKIGGKLSDDVEIIQREGAKIVHLIYSITRQNFRAGRWLVS